MTAPWIMISKTVHMMRTLTCMVVDDEPLAVRLMESYVNKTPGLELKGSFGSGAMAFEALVECPVDILLCDIQMPGLSGMELSRMLPPRTKVIFTTAFSDYALEGFKVSALDYLLKPISYTDFLSSIRKAREWFGREGEGGSGDGAPMSSSDGPGNESSLQGPRKKSIFLKTEYRLQQVSLDDILYIEGMGDYVKVCLQDGSQVVSLCTLKAMGEQLPKDRFLRISKSYIVGIEKVTTLERGRVVFGDVRIPLSEQVKDEFFSLLSKSSLLPGDQG